MDIYIVCDRRSHTICSMPINSYTLTLNFYEHIDELWRCAPHDKYLKFTRANEQVLLNLWVTYGFF